MDRLAAVAAATHSLAGPQSPGRQGGQAGSRSLGRDGGQPRGPSLASRALTGIPFTLRAPSVPLSLGGKSSTAAWLGWQQRQAKQPGAWQDPCGSLHQHHHLPAHLYYTHCRCCCCLSPSSPHAGSRMMPSRSLARCCCCCRRLLRSPAADAVRRYWLAASARPCGIPTHGSERKHARRLKNASMH